ncbi:alpha/beta hydrolase [Bradyrhizobium sp. CB2312]|uniref:alpha/beta hydrolase n=1 Tax=Bradyrhizobium sp. CB2312 TaxID=3039155 RepID=UPI0024B17C32|nr:alpha/beta hydrolase [Bradyrhizobium sp. CB2312]WFU76688.1 alpha/beta hydrolase [Bradyrhizobium sp. CB2312]
MPSHDHYLLKGAGPDHTPLLMLHGSGGTERDMVPLASQLAPSAMAVAVRGAVPWEGGFAFFRRFEDRSIDERDLVARAGRLADDVAQTGLDYRFPKPPIAIGFSNGAIMAAALLMLYPQCLSAAVLLRPLSPFATDPATRLPRTPVLIIDGHHDERRSPGDGARLARRLAHMGAEATHHQLPAGHSITEDDIRLAREWLRPLL